MTESSELAKERPDSASGRIGRRCSLVPIAGAYLKELEELDCDT